MAVTISGCRAGSAACGGRVVAKPLGFNHLCPIPNGVSGATLKTLKPHGARAMIAPPCPDLVLVGGGRRPFRLDKAHARRGWPGRLVALSRSARAVLLVSTSPPTPKAVGLALKGAIDRPAHNPSPGRWRG